MEKEGIGMEPSSGKTTTLVLRTRLCSESKLSRLISHLHQATVFGFSALTLLVLAFPAQGDFIWNGGFEKTTPPNTTSFQMPDLMPPGATGPLPGWTFTASNSGTLPGQTNY